MAVLPQVVVENQERLVVSVKSFSVQVTSIVHQTKFVTLAPRVMASATALAWDTKTNKVVQQTMGLQ